jgi:hypothetical protein
MFSTLSCSNIPSARHTLQVCDLHSSQLYLEELIMPEFRVSLIACGCIGALLPDIIRLIKNRYDPTVPGYLKGIKFWISLLFLVLIGGLATWLSNAHEVKEALAYGYGAPEFLSRLLSSPDRAAGVDRGVEFSTTRWWSR